MQVTKLEGLGNDYLFLNCLEGAPDDLPALARRLSDRHFGVGSDGIICVRPGGEGDFSMEMYNADGSRGAMCGNGIRCLGKYVYENGLTRKDCLLVDTDAGPRTLELHLQGNRVTQVTVDMGVPTLGTPIPLEWEGTEYTLHPVELGNPHAVVFVSHLDTFPLENLGAHLQTHPHFPDGVNLECAVVRSPQDIALAVWERGSGITLACGTGACAVFAAARRQGLCGPEATLTLPGGTLQVSETEEGSLRMTGPARRVFSAEVPL